MKHVFSSLITAVALLAASCGTAQTKPNSKYPDPKTVSHDAAFSMKLTDAQWKARLTSEQY